MAARLDQLLLFRKAEDGGVMAIPDTLSLSDMIEDSLLECQPIFNSRNVQVRMEGVDPLGILVRIDKTLLSVILNNLLYNASVWAQSTVMLSVETPAPGCVSIAVSDDGNGFPPELIGADLSNALGGDDQGLLNTLGTGLYLCAFSARAMTDANLPCTLALSNREDAGATVTIMLNNQPA
jgi:K+-sensing histidine kinase KdpD